ncbi:hypothetical protein BH10BAC3_BH10BAC3_24700 [soil metagenome]
MRNYYNHRNSFLAILLLSIFAGNSTAFGQTDTIKVTVPHLARIDTIKAQIAAARLTIMHLASLDTIKVQPSISSIEIMRMARIDTIKVKPVFPYDTNPDTIGKTLQGRLVSLMANTDQLYLNSTTKRKRVLVNTALHVGIYAGSMIVLNQAWYADYPRSSFHTFNDNKEWLQVDKAGHAWSAYQISRTSMASWKWAGLSRKQQIWIGGLAGAVFQTVIEVQDGFSAEWGWSWGDFAANCIGSGLLISQQLAWNEQRISYKFSFHKMHYDDPMLNNRSDSLFGSSLPERALKDYNGQTYWLSANLHSFFPKSKLPPWLNVAVGYGASGMFGGYNNKWESGGAMFDRSDIPRQRQWYLAPDIDFTRIKTKSKFLKTTFFILNAFKFPAPALMLSNGKLKVHAIYF